MAVKQISSNIDELNKLHATHAWLPNEDMIRPNNDDLFIKRNVMREIRDDWIDVYHYILHTVFNLEYARIAKKKFVPDLSNAPEWIFQESLFRYNLPQETNHYVLWFSKCKYEDGKTIIDSETIDAIVSSELRSKATKFNYAWYINPKPSVTEFFHVQVFWIVCSL